MVNKEIELPNFVLLRQMNDKGPLYMVTICKSTLNVLEEKVINEIPKDWSVNDFYGLLDEGNRFFSPFSDNSTGNYKV